MVTENDSRELSAAWFFPQLVFTMLGITTMLNSFDQMLDRPEKKMCFPCTLLLLLNYSLLLLCSASKLVVFRLAAGILLASIQHMVATKSPASDDNENDNGGSDLE